MSCFFLVSLILSFRSVSALSSHGRPATTAPFEPPNVVSENSNHIFNTIHSAMRQWGSSLNHNGMTFFMATVPQGTELYHGNGWPDPVKGMEWIALEPEHASLFASRFVRSTDVKNGALRYENDQDETALPKDHFPLPLAARVLPARKYININDAVQSPIHHQREDDELSVEPGYLHTYTAKHSLHLIYIDGMSAGKTSNGTLDTQDYVLLHGDDLGDEPVFSDWPRAHHLCDMTHNEFEDKVDGFVRMEGGFEIIMCNFEKSLDILRVIKVGKRALGLVGGERDLHEVILNYYRAVTARYHGIGGGRVAINYDNFVTAYNYPLDLFPGSSEMPRLNEASDKVLSAIKAELVAVVTNGNAFAPSTNWQVVADQVVQRYSDRLGRLASEEFSEIKALHADVELALIPFIDYDNRNMTTEVENCQRQFLPTEPSRDLSIAALHVSDVIGAICGTLSQLLADEEYDTAKARINGLVEWLGWSSWKTCPLCGYDEICFIPMWPFGTFEDRRRPSCTKGGEIMRKMGYWGSWRPNRGL